MTIKRTKFEHSRSTLTTRQYRILSLLGAGNYPAKVAKILGIHRSAVHYWVKKFLKLGYIELQCKDVVKFYRLTPLGSKILTGSEGVRARVVALEDYPVKFEVLEDVKKRVDWVRLGRPRNWVKLGFRVGGVRVVKTSKSVIVHPGRIEGFDPYELIYLSRRVCDRVAAWLESHLGMKLGRGVPVRRPGFQVKDPFGKFVAEYVTVANDVGSVDASPPSKEGHVDIWGPEYTKDYLLMPAKFSLLQNEVRKMNSELQDLKAGLTTILQTWNMVGNKLLELLNRLEKKEERR